MPAKPKRDPTRKKRHAEKNRISLRLLFLRFSSPPPCLVSASQPQSTFSSSFRFYPFNILLSLLFLLLRSLFLSPSCHSLYCFDRLPCSIPEERKASVVRAFLFLLFVNDCSSIVLLLGLIFARSSCFGLPIHNGARIPTECAPSDN